MIEKLKISINKDNIEASYLYWARGMLAEARIYSEYYKNNPDKEFINKIQCLENEIWKIQKEYFPDFSNPNQRKPLIGEKKHES